MKETAVLLAGVLCLAACGKKAEAPSVITASPGGGQAATPPAESPAPPPPPPPPPGGDAPAPPPQEAAQAAPGPGDGPVKVGLSVYDNISPEQKVIADRDRRFRGWAFQLKSGDSSKQGQARSAIARLAGNEKNEWEAFARRYGINP